MTALGTAAARRLVGRQRSAAERLRRELARADGTLDHSYFRAFRRDTGRVAEPIPLEAIFGAAAESDLVYLGDFHAVRASQSFALRVLTALARGARANVLGIEFVYTRQQRLLDLRQRGDLDEAAFLRRIHYEEEWGWPWEGYRELLDGARALGVPVVALDRAPRGGVDRIASRDDHAARRIVASLLERPGHRMLVFFGESHLAGRHLPRRVREHAGRNGIALRDIRVFQDPDRAYWSFVSAGEPVPDAVAFGEGGYGVFHTAPLAKYESYRQILDRWKGDLPGDEDVDLTPAVHHLIDVLRGWLGLSRSAKLRHRAGWEEELSDAYPEVYGGGEALRLLGPILREHGRSDEEVGEARERLAERGVFYESRSNTMFIERYAPGRTAGEVARFLRTALTGRLFQEPELSEADPVDRAYGAAYNEALAYLGARLVDPGSDVVTRDERRVLAGAAAGGVDEARVRLAWIESHRRFEESGANLPPATLTAPLRASRALRRTLARDLGHRLGQSWFAAVAGGRLRTAALRRIFSAPLDPPRARGVVVRWLRRLRGNR
ncbi:MAG TPA: ChaN family lipoprotein [Candidatus Polarisedimenticolaceae bacterium]